jgi:gliding motility-associated-like protein
MKGKCIITVIIILFSHLASAQNMVPNPGFETVINCPTNWAMIGYSPSYNNFLTVDAWVSPLENTTPDYFNKCAGLGDKVNIPETYLGYQDAHNGDGVAGIITYYENNGDEYREYIEAKLNTKMISGHKYAVSFFVSTNYNSATGFNYIGIDRVGAAFTTNQINVTPEKYLMLDYAVVSDSANYFTTPNSWVKVEGAFIAQGDEEWIIIGTFKTSKTPFTTVQLYPPVKNPGSQDYSYLFVDDVNVTDLDKVNTFTSVHDTSVCVVDDLVLTSPVTAASYLWNTGENTQSIVINDSGTFWCGAKNGNNEYTDTFHLRRMYFYPSLNLGNDTLICGEDHFTLGLDLPFVTYYMWNTGATSCCIQPQSSGEYFLTMSNGCDVLSDTISITNIACENCFWAPNAITANGDGKNDKFGVKSLCLLSKATFSIFDRWGTMVFTTDNLTDKWDGTYNGEKWPLGTYSYMVEYWSIANKPKKVFKGNFIMIR